MNIAKDFADALFARQRCGYGFSYHGMLSLNRFELRERKNTEQEKAA
jgi:hypothetical protein